MKIPDKYYKQAEKLHREAMTIVVRNYPCNLTFKVIGTLPPFEYGEKMRTSMLRHELESQSEKWRDVPHEVMDFVVEEVIKTVNGEEWVIGS